MPLTLDLAAGGDSSWATHCGTATLEAGIFSIGSCEQRCPAMRCAFRRIFVVVHVALQVPGASRMEQRR